MDQPLVSIITPSLNQGEYIEETIESVSAQTYEPIEHIVVDGGSTDGTVDILSSYDHLTWISEPDDGQANAINKGLEMASGDVVTWLNSDDIYVTIDTVENAVDSFIGDVNVVHGDLAFIDADSTVYFYSVSEPFDHRKYLLGWQHRPLQPSTFFEGALFREYSLNEAYDYAFDLEQWIRLGSVAKTSYNPMVLAGFRWHPTSKTVSEENQFDIERQRLADEYPAYAGQAVGINRGVRMTASGIKRRVVGLKRFVDLKRSTSRLTLPGSIKFAGWRTVLTTSFSADPGG